MTPREEFRSNYKEYDALLPNFCANCEATEFLDIHHVVPLSMGGRNILTNMVRLCESCHGVIHQLKRSGNRALIKEGIRRRKEAGLHTGRPNVCEVKLQEALRIYYETEATIKEITNTTGISQGSLYKTLKERQLPKRSEIV